MTITTAVLLTIGAVCVWALWRLSRTPPYREADHVSRAWLEVFVRDRRDS